MLQYHFAQPPSMPAPSSSMASNNVMSMYKRNHRFTERILSHGGPQRDTTIDATTKAQKRQKQQFEKKFVEMDHIMKEFEEEMCRIEEMRVQIVSNQVYMAKCAQEHYAAVTIQQAYRGASARHQLTILKKLRLLRLWIHFRIHFRRRIKAARYISITLRKYFARQRFHTILIQNRAAKKLQKMVRSKQSYMLLRVCLTLLRQVKRTRDHVMLFAERKAFRKILLLNVPKELKPDPMEAFMRKCIRKRRQRM